MIIDNVTRMINDEQEANVNTKTFTHILAIKKLNDLSLLSK